MKTSLSVALISTLLILVAFVNFWKLNAAENGRPIMRCKEKTLIVKLGDLRFEVPRASSSVRLENKKTLNSLDRETAELPCSQSEISAQAVMITKKIDFQMIDLNDAQRVMGKYKIARDLLKHSKIQNLPNGIKFFSYKEMEYFFLPQDKAPTYDGSPVVLECTKNNESNDLTSSCWALFTDLDGLLISYRFARKYYKPENYLNAHLERVEILSSMKLK